MGTRAPKGSVGCELESSELESSELDELRDVVSRNIRPCTFLARAPRYEAEPHHRRAGNLGLSVVGINPDVHVAVEPVADSELSGTRILLVWIARSTLAEHPRVLADSSADGDCLLPEALPIANPAAASLWRYLHYLHAESLAPESALHDDGTSRCAEQLLASLMRAATERADAAPATGVDSRTLDSAFCRRHGAGPLSWLDQRRTERTLGARGGREPVASAGGGRPPLTARELEIARLVAGGFNNLEIANALSISRNTIKEALKRIFRKVAVDSRAELVLRLAEAGLL